MKGKGNFTTSLSLLVLIIFSGMAIAQDETEKTGWKGSLIFDITTTQAAYSDSWVGGEAGALSWVGNLNASAEKQLSPAYNFKSSLKLSFGQTHSQKIDEITGEKYWEKPKKSTDLIDFENVLRMTRNWHVDPYAAFRLESQFMDASVDSYKRYFNPVKLTESAGVAHKFYDKDESIIISRFGFALRQIFRNVITQTYDEALGDDWETTDSTLTDSGIESVTDVKLNFHKNLQYSSKLTLYKALYFSGKDKVAGTEFEDDWKAVDVNWENIISASITKIVTVNFYTQILYDKEVSKKGRFKETLGIGFVFKMM